MSKTNIFWETIDVFKGGKRWNQGALRGVDNKICLMGGLSLAKDGHSCYLSESRDTVILSPLAKVIKEQFPERAYTGSSYNTVIDFNDHEDTTYEDVRLVLEKTAIQQDEVL